MNQSQIDQLMQSAVDHHRAGRFADAESIYRKILTSNPRFAPALQFLGVIRGQLGHLPESINLISRAISVSPSADAYTNLGYFLAAAGKTADAIVADRKAVALNPNSPAAHCNLGNALKESGQLNLAIQSLQRAVELDPRDVTNLTNLGGALTATKRFDEAEKSLRNAIHLQPNFADAHNNLANTLKKQRKYAEALPVILRALELNPNLPEAHNNLGSIQMELGQIDSAISSYRRAIALKPDLAGAHWNFAHPLLLKGEFREGWQKYRYRWTLKEQITPRSFPQPLWTGQPLKGKTILLHAEQGLGDTIQFARFAAMVQTLGSQVILECQPALHRLLTLSFPQIKIISAGDPLPDFDFHSPLLDLPETFNVDINSIPAPIPYLKSDPADTEKFASKLRATGHKKIALIWSGRPEHRNDHNRSIPSELLYPLSSIPNIDWYTWQIPSNPSLATHLKMTDLSNDIQDFADTASILSQMDLLITVDTSSAHLAGALGRPTWLLLPFLPDWRWMLDRPDSPWYPAMRLFRQPSLNDWPSVIQSLLPQL